MLTQQSRVIALKCHAIKITGFAQILGNFSTDALQMFLSMCRIPDDHMVACETGAGGCDATLSWPASAYCS